MWELTNAAEGRALVGGTMAFALWMLVLTGALVSSRGAVMAADGAKITDFPAGIRHGGDRYWRLNRAHANTAENVGLVAAVLLGTLAVGLSGPDVRLLPWAIVAARIVQSSVHVTSGEAWAVGLRATAFVVQLLALGWLSVRCLWALFG